MTEEDFWKRYFQSKLFNAHRASIRSSATQHVVKDDDILDKYLEKDDDGGCILNPHMSSFFKRVYRTRTTTATLRWRWSIG